MSEVCTKLTEVQKSQQRNSTDVGDDDFISFDSVMKVPLLPLSCFLGQIRCEAKLTNLK